MKLPKLQPTAAKTITINDFSGGLNLRDGMSEILDNQLTESKNMWWSDGVLKTRPGIENRGEGVISNEILECGNNFDLKTHDIYKYDEKLGNCRMVSRSIHYFDICFEKGTFSNLNTHE